MTDPTFPVPGRYRHYKGGEYQVVDVARHSETEEWLVVYRPLYDTGVLGSDGQQGLWVRPLDMFVESVDVNGGFAPRFTLIEPSLSLT